MASLRVAFIVSIVCASLLVVAIHARPAASGDWLPIGVCTAAEPDTGIVLMTMYIWDHRYPQQICRTVIDPLAHDGYPAVPILQIDCPPGFTAEPDTIPGGFVIHGCVGTDTEFSPGFILHLRSRFLASDTFFYKPDGTLMQEFPFVESCGQVTPAHLASWGLVKSQYR